MKKTDAGNIVISMAILLLLYMACCCMAPIDHCPYCYYYNLICDDCYYCFYNGYFI